MSRYTVKYLTESEYASWDSFIDECIHGNIFNKSFYLKTLADLLNIQFSILVILNKDNDIVGGFAHCHNRKIGFNYTYIPPLVPFYSLVVKERNTKYASKKERFNKEIIHKIIEELSKVYVYLDFRFPPSFKDIRPLTFNDFLSKVAYTYITNISDPGKLFNHFDQDVKRRIKKTQETNHQFVKDNSEQTAKTFFNLQQKSYTRQNLIFKLNQTQFIKYANELRHHDCINIYTIYYENVPITSCFVILENRKSYYLLSGTDIKYSKFGFNQLLIWETIKDLSKNGIEYFDFIGGNNESIAQYKSGFNFQLQPLYQTKKYNSKIFKILFSIKKNT